MSRMDEAATKLTEDFRAFGVKFDLLDDQVIKNKHGEVVIDLAANDIKAFNCSVSFLVPVPMAFEEHLDDLDGAVRRIAAGALYGIAKHLEDSE